MLAYRVVDMTCGHCARAITQAVRKVDPSAHVAVDLNRHLVSIDAVETSAGAFRDAIAQAGYTPVPVQAQPAGPSGTRDGGCCCGTAEST